MHHKFHSRRLRIRILAEDEFNNSFPGKDLYAPFKFKFYSDLGHLMVLLYHTRFLFKTTLQKDTVLVKHDN